jgi:hypothetical protein
VSADLALIIETSWAREDAIPPHHIYLNIAYHLSTEARAGLSQFRLPGRFEQELFEFQKSAVKIAARHLHRRGGVMIGDVVGLGKTMMATAAGPHVRGRPGLRNPHHLPQEPGAHVGTLPH